MYLFDRYLAEWYLAYICHNKKIDLTEKEVCSRPVRSIQ